MCCGSVFSFTPYKRIDIEPLQLRDGDGDANESVLLRKTFSSTSVGYMYLHTTF